MANVPGLLRVGPVVVLDGCAAKTVRDALFIAANARRLSGLSTATYAAIAQVLTDALMSATGHSDVRLPPTPEHLPIEPPTVPIGQAAEALGISPRQARRLARQLGGRKVGGRWLLDRTAIDEHLQGKTQWTDSN